MYPNYAVAQTYTPYSVHPAVNYGTRPTFVGPPPAEPPQRPATNPWSSGFKAGDPGKEVIDVAQLVASQRTADIQINPVISANTRSPRLRIDLREAFENIKLIHRKSDSEIELKSWKDQDEPLTLPILNSVVVISPLLPQPLVISNPTGVTVGKWCCPRHPLSSTSDERFLPR